MSEARIARVWARAIVAFARSSSRFINSERFEACPDIRQFGGKLGIGHLLDLAVGILALLDTNAGKHTLFLDGRNGCGWILHLDCQAPGLFGFIEQRG